MEYTLVPIEDRAELFIFDGTFDIGEDISNGQVVTWKYPQNTEFKATICSLKELDDNPIHIIARIFRLFKDINSIYLEGVKGYTGWYQRKDVL